MQVLSPWEPNLNAEARFGQAQAKKGSTLFNAGSQHEVGQKKWAIEIQKTTPLQDNCSMPEFNYS